MAADCCGYAGVPLQFPVVEESTALGAAICAGVGAGFWKGTDEGAASVAAFARTVEPKPEVHALYRDLADQWLEVYSGSMEVVEAGLLRPLWRAAGT